MTVPRPPRWSSVTAPLLDQEAASDERSPYQCDGRVQCSEMTSCEEAEFFLANCPGVKMDGGGDGHHFQAFDLQRLSGITRGLSETAPFDDPERAGGAGG